MKGGKKKRDKGRKAERGKERRQERKFERKIFPLELNIICVHTAICVPCELLNTNRLLHIYFFLFPLYVCLLIF